MLSVAGTPQHSPCLLREDRKEFRHKQLCKPKQGIRLANSSARKKPWGESPQGQLVLLRSSPGCRPPLRPSGKPLPAPETQTDQTRANEENSRRFRNRRAPAVAQRLPAEFAASAAIALIVHQVRSPLLMLIGTVQVDRFSYTSRSHGSIRFKKGAKYALVTERIRVNLRIKPAIRTRIRGCRFRLARAVRALNQWRIQMDY